MRNRLTYLILSVTALLCGCSWDYVHGNGGKDSCDVHIDRYDRVEQHYLTTGDYAALQQMRTDYPAQTRTLIEDVLCLGQVNEPGIYTSFLKFYDDSTLQAIITDVQEQYSDMSDIDRQLEQAFAKLRQLLPDLQAPAVYTQIGALNQSIIVGDSLLGISLDKYLGKDYQPYIRYGYNTMQRNSMTRKYIVPDCLSFFILRHYPLPSPDGDGPEAHRRHMAKIQWIVNQCTDKPVFNNPHIDSVARLVSSKKLTAEKLLQMKNEE